MTPSTNLSHNCHAAIRLIGGRPVIYHGDAPVSQAVYLDRIMRGDWEERVREFVESGVCVFHLLSPHGGADYCDSAFWLDDGDYPLEDESKFPFTLERQARFILSLQPAAKFFIDFAPAVPLAWSLKYPEEMQTDEDGKKYREASIASERYLRDVRQYICHLVNYVETREWGERMIGYKILPYTEGLLALTAAGKMFDCSEKNEQAFRAWVKQRYGTLRQLRQAWNDPHLTFARVRVPRDRDWMARRAGGQPTLGGQLVAGSPQPLQAVKQQGLFHWIEPGNAMPEHDYCRFMREAFLRWVRTLTGAVKESCAALHRLRLVGIDATKQPLMGWEIAAAFDGTGDGHTFPNILQLSGSWDTGEMLDDADLDFIWTPADYTARAVGFAYEAEGLSDSLVLRGKTMIIENDARSYVGEGKYEQGAFRDIAEVEAGLLRNAALTLSRGLQSYWCNIGSSYFHDIEIQRSIARLTPMLDRLNAAPHRETREAIALIIDDSSPLYEDFTSGYQYLSVVWQRVLGLAHCGIPYRIYLLSDLRKENFPAYKVYLFPNLFKIDDEVLALLREKVLRDGNVAIFGPATGITDGKYLGAAGASELLGLPMELLPRTCQRHVIVQDHGHPITRELPANLIYGDSLAYGPLLAPAYDTFTTDTATALGLTTACWFVNRTGLFVKELGNGAAGNGRPGMRSTQDAALVWSVAMPLPANLLRAIARYAGCNVWCEEDDVIYASESIVAIHTAKAGPRTIRLPKPCTVTDALTDQLIGRELREITLQMRSPETRIFQLEYNCLADPSVRQ